MSGIPPENMSRITAVARKTYLGSDRIQGAQDASGLSNEAIARLIPVSEKTWRRWKKAGTIPTASLPVVAAALGLELSDAGVSSERVEQLAADLRETQQALRDLPKILARLARIEELLAGRADDTQPP